MDRRGWLACAAALLAAITVASGRPANAADVEPPAKTVAQATQGLPRLAGLLPVYLDTKGGRVLLALSPDAKGDCGEYLYQVYMRSGLGSTPVGHRPRQSRRLNPDHGAFRRVGPKRIMARSSRTTDFAPT